MMHHDHMLRAADAIDGAMKVLRPASPEYPLTRADLFRALEAAGDQESHNERVMAWERVRYLSVTVDGVSTPLYALMRDPENQADPYTVGRVPSFAALLGMLNRVAGMEARA
ncbi:hypothetical protein MRBLMI12_000467 [Microbacterium sp. LMI12-1-1.1]|uniref:hypothetical protein n=1 Tax=Microbacterium sp. LMI12-1-1.1 TaxID=3135225 RepID=UPI0034131735